MEHGNADLRIEVLCERLCARRLVIDGTDFAIEIDRRDVREVYLPLAREIAMRAEGIADRRYMVGIAGPPGAGKTATATILTATMEELPGAPRPAVIPLDGFHYPNAYLRSHEGIGHDGQLRPLWTMKGWHTTFDGGRALEALRRVRAGESLRLPVYSRTLHEPVEGVLSVELAHRVAIVEGNYLFLDVEPWRRIRELFDLRVFVTAPLEVLRRQLIERHMRGGRSPEEARRKVELVDLPNMEAVLPTERYADVIISGPRGACALRWRSKKFLLPYVNRDEE